MVSPACWPLPASRFLVAPRSTQLAKPAEAAETATLAEAAKLVQVAPAKKSKRQEPPPEAVVRVQVAPARAVETREQCRWHCKRKEDETGDHMANFCLPVQLMVFPEGGQPMLILRERQGGI